MVMFEPLAEKEILSCLLPIILVIDLTLQWSCQETTLLADEMGLCLPDPSVQGIVDLSIEVKIISR